MKTIPPFRLKPEPLNEAAKNLPKFKWAGDNIGTRHQLGGEPTYIQAKIHPVCPDCKEKMTFYAHRRHSFCGHFPLRKNLPSIHHHHGAGWALTYLVNVLCSYTLAVFSISSTNEKLFFD